MVLTSRSGLCLVLFSLAGSIFAEHASPAHQKDTGANPAKKRARGLRKGASPSVDSQRGMKEAVDEALGAGHGIDQQGLDEIRQLIEPMWLALAKNPHGRVDRRSLRYVAQRFFLWRHSLSIVGLEASHANSTTSEAALLTSFAPNYIRKLVDGHDVRNGFGIEDAVTMIVALKRLIEHSGNNVLENVYLSQHVDSRQDVSRATLGKIMEGYMLRWMMGDDMENIALLEGNASLREASFEDWPHIAGFAQGRITSFEYARQHVNRRGSHAGAGNALRPHFSFADAQEVVGDITTTFGSFWETQCADVKDSLLKMDHTNTGRVKLSDFHGAALNGEWRFSESKEYLREMGALDETSAWHGPRIVITNYLQAPSNCIVSAEHYRVCCSNECEQYLSELEDSVRAPLATHEEILPVIQRMRSGFEDEEPRLTPSLKSQLKEIARANSGKVPIHGRLFAQWLHHVFPLECPFPHKSGTTTTLTPSAFGNYMASEDEMNSHSEQSADMSGVAQDEEITQWSHEEELLADLSPAPWQADFSTSALGLMLMAGVFALLNKMGVISVGSGKAGGILPTHAPNGLKSHYV